MALEQIGSGHGTIQGDLSYKYQRLRERLRLAVKNGELTGKLPGERELARRYSANAKTINKALNDLAMEGLILRHVGRGTFVAGSSPSRKIPAMPSRNFAWIAPGVDHSDEKAIFSIAFDYLQAKGHRMQSLDGQLDDSGELPDSTLPPRLMRQIDGLIICSARPSRELLANLRRRHMPVVLVNNHHSDIRLPAVLADQSHGAFVLVEKCVQSGHRQIQLLLRPDSLPGAAAAQAGYQAAMQYYGLQPLPTIEVDSRFNWTSLAGDNRPTALVCVTGKLATEARQKLSQAGLSIPTDMSIGAICGPGESCAQQDAVTSYDFDPRRVFHWATEFLTEGMSPHGPQVAIVPGRLNDRGSICPPRSRPEQPAGPRGETAL